MTRNYCVFCQTGYEHQVAESLSQLGFEPLIAIAKRIVVENGVDTHQQRSLLPGYVFFRTDALEPSGRMGISKIDRIIKLLCYDDYDCALRGRDSKFVDWLWERDGVLDISHVYREGDRIRILDGPLKDLEGQIVQVNLKRKCVAISISGKSMLGKIWCSVEVVEDVQRFEAPLKNRSD